MAPGRGPVRAGLAALLALAAGGCGTSAERSNARPARPARPPIVVNASISPARVSVSPTRFGAGPVRLVVANLTRTSQQITLESAGRGSPALRRQSAPINPRDTATLRADMGSGRYLVHVAGARIQGATLRVSGRRHIARNDRLQP